MFEAYRVSVNLVLQDGVSRGMKLISKTMLGLRKEVRELNTDLTAVERNLRNLKSLTNSGIGNNTFKGATGSASSLNSQLNRTNTNLSGMNARLGIATQRMAALKTGMGGITPIKGLGGVGSGGGSSGGGNNVDHAYGGYMALRAGQGMFGLMGKAYSAGAEFDLQAAKFRALGLGPKLNEEAINYAKNLNSFGLTMTDNLELLRDAQTVFRDSATIDEAKMVTPLMAKMKYANTVLYGDQGQERASKFMDMLRVVELRGGLKDPENFNRQANMIQQILTTSGGRVDATQYLNMIKTGGVAAKGLSDRAIYYQLEPIIQEMGGARVGAGLMAGYTNLSIGRMVGVSAAQEMTRLGLLDPSKVVLNRIGTIKKVQPGAIKGNELLQQSPVDWLEQVMLPAFAAHGITGREKILQEFATVMTNQRGSNLLSTIYLQLAQIHKSEKLSAGAQNIDEAAASAATTPTGQLLELHKQYDAVLIDIGATTMPAVLKGMRGLAWTLHGIADFAKEHPAITGIIEGVAAIMATTLVIGGAVMLFSSALGALGLTGVLTTITGSVIGLSRAVMLNPYVLGLLAAAAAGAAIGTGVSWLIDKGVQAGSGQKDETLGGWLYEKIHGTPDIQGHGNKGGLANFIKNGASVSQKPFSGVASGKVNSIYHVHVDTHIDGEKVASNSVRHIAGWSSGAAISAAGFDTQQHPLLPGMPSPQ